MSSSKPQGIRRAAEMSNYRSAPQSTTRSHSRPPSQSGQTPPPKGFSGYAPRPTSTRSTSANRITSGISTDSDPAQSLLHLKREHVVVQQELAFVKTQLQRAAVLARKRESQLCEILGATPADVGGLETKLCRLKEELLSVSTLTQRCKQLERDLQQHQRPLAAAPGELDEQMVIERDTYREECARLRQVLEHKVYLYGALYQRYAEEQEGRRARERADEDARGREARRAEAVERRRRALDEGEAEEDDEGAIAVEDGADSGLVCAHCGNPPSCADASAASESLLAVMLGDAGSAASLPLGPARAAVVRLAGRVREVEEAAVRQVAVERGRVRERDDEVEALQARCRLLQRQWEATRERERAHAHGGATGGADSVLEEVARLRQQRDEAVTARKEAEKALEQTRSQGGAGATDGELTLDEEEEEDVSALMQAVYAQAEEEPAEPEWRLNAARAEQQQAEERAAIEEERRAVAAERAELARVRVEQEAAQAEAARELVSREELVLQQAEAAQLRREEEARAEAAAASERARVEEARAEAARVVALVHAEQEAARVEAEAREREMAGLRAELATALAEAQSLAAAHKAESAAVIEAEGAVPVSAQVEQLRAVAEAAETVDSDAELELSVSGDELPLPVPGAGLAEEAESEAESKVVPMIVTDDAPVEAAPAPMADLGDDLDGGDLWLDEPLLEEAHASAHAPDAEAENPVSVLALEEPAVEPAEEPAEEPTELLAEEPVEEPVEEPTMEPAEEPTMELAEEPTMEPAEEPTMEPAEEPTMEPAEEPDTIDFDYDFEPVEDPIPVPVEEPAPEPTADALPIEDASLADAEPSIAEPAEPVSEAAPEQAEPAAADGQLGADEALQLDEQPTVDADALTAEEPELVAAADSFEDDFEDSDPDQAPTLAEPAESTLEPLQEEPSLVEAPAEPLDLDEPAVEAAVEVTGEEAVEEAAELLTDMRADPTPLDEPISLAESSVEEPASLDEPAPAPAAEEPIEPTALEEPTSLEQPAAAPLDLDDSFPVYEAIEDLAPTVPAESTAEPARDAAEAPATSDGRAAEVEASVSPEAVPAPAPAPVPTPLVPLPAAAAAADAEQSMAYDDPFEDDIDMDF